MNDTNTFIELTDDDKSQLKHIYLSRLRLFISVYAIIIPLVFLYGSEPFFMKRDQYGHYLWHDSGLTQKQMGIISTAFLLVPVIATGLWIFKKSIYSYQKDIKNGVKQIVPYVITMKRHMAPTHQFFIGFDDPNYMHHEVDEDIYYSLSLGDIVGVHRAPISGYTFNMRGRYTLM